MDSHAYELRADTTYADLDEAMDGGEDASVVEPDEVTEELPPACDTCHGHGTADGLPAASFSEATGWVYRDQRPSCGDCGGSGDAGGWAE